MRKDNLESGRPAIIKTTTRSIKSSKRKVRVKEAERKSGDHIAGTVKINNKRFFKHSRKMKLVLEAIGPLNKDTIYFLDLYTILYQFCVCLHVENSMEVWGLIPRYKNWNLEIKVIQKVIYFLKC